MDAMYLRLSAHRQSWGRPKTTGNVITTERIPTVTGLWGLIAATQGWFRGCWEDWIYDTEFSVRIDRRGYVPEDFQTIATHEDERAYRRDLIMCMTGGKARDNSEIFTPQATKDNKSKTTCVHREILTDAEFIVQVTHPEKLDDIVDGLCDPKFAPYLGRKSHMPTFPLFLGWGREGLLDTMPTLVEDLGRRVPCGDVTLEQQKLSVEKTNPVTHCVVPGLTCRTDQHDWWDEHLSRKPRRSQLG